MIKKGELRFLPKDTEIFLLKKQLNIKSIDDCIIEIYETCIDGKSVFVKPKKDSSVYIPYYNDYGNDEWIVDYNNTLEYNNENEK